jgi:pyruvyltransferase
MEVVLKHWIDVPNAGDAFARDIAERYIGPVAAVAEANPSPQTNLLIIGSLMSWVDENTIVCGAGMISPQQLPRSAPKQFVSVRGPLTRYYLVASGFDAPERFGDPGILAGDFVESAIEPEFRIGVILHHAEGWAQKKLMHRKLGWRRDINFIDISSSPLNVLTQIARCDTIFSSSLHGIIFAHALQRPAAWLELSDRIVGKGFKFYDYYLSLGVSPDDVPLLHSNEVINLRNFEHLPRLHDTRRLIAQCRESLALVKRTLSRGEDERPRESELLAEAVA